LRCKFGSADPSAGGALAVNAWPSARMWPVLVATPLNNDARVIPAIPSAAGAESFVDDLGLIGVERQLGGEAVAARRLRLRPQTRTIDAG
jgi:hypothetical protein